MSKRARTLNSKRLRTIMRWVQFLGWTAFWVWSAVTDDPNQPWRAMFSMTCFILAWGKAFEKEDVQ